MLLFDEVKTETSISFPPNCCIAVELSDLVVTPPVMVVNARPLKRMKSRVTADLYDFLSFPSPTQFPGAFRTNVRGFLAKHAMMPPPSSLFPHLMTWQIQFRVDDESASESPESPPAMVVCLDIIEEDVARSRSIYCDQCRVVGWSGHPVCGKRYHFIIKADGHSIGGYHKPCICCGDVLHLSESKCKSCNLETNTDDVEDWVYKQLENTTHLLHGVIHSNGYGHLLRVNGREGGSRILSGRLIMDFWDRLCKALGARKVSVMDVSIKYGLEYRLLHSITKGRPWYGDWGYEFGAGSFALTGDAYERSIESLSNLPLSIFLTQEEQKTHPPLSNIISNYQSLSENKLVNVRDLFCFVLDLLHDARKRTSSCDVSADSKIQQVDPSGKLCSWARRDVERVTASMLRVLCAVSRSNWVSRRSLKGAVYKSGAPELLDHCLQELGGKTASNRTVVNARLNLETNALEYRMEAQVLDPESIPACDEPRSSSIPSEENLAQDLRQLYNGILHPRTMEEYEPQATRSLAASSAGKLLDCKQFVKNYEPEKACFANNNAGTAPRLLILCEVELVDEVEGSSTKPPPELVAVPRSATVAELKLEASKAFQDVYVVFRRFRAEDESGDESVRVESVWGPEAVVRVRGRCQVKHGLSRFRMERGVERWTVECVCGARDDDGERMSACDICSVWHHTRCSGIPDSEAVPASFVCHRCRTNGALTPL